jgi:hypothetical protein
LVAVGVEVTGVDDEDPVGPERPVNVNGPESDELAAGPVRPELLDDDDALVTPESPDVANGMADRIEVPPEPPPLELVPTLEPPVAAASPPGPSSVTRFRTGAPPAEKLTPAPPPPPWPPVDTAPIPLAAVPVSPERALAFDPAPLLALESAAPAATAGPVAPELPVLPVVTAPPPTTVALPRMAVFVAVGFDVAEPVPPVAPDPPEVAAGCDAAPDVADPVSPVFVLPDWALAAPEFPVFAVGVMVTVELPPLPPLELPVATPAPPVDVTIWAPAGRTARIRAAPATRKANANDATRRAGVDGPVITAVLVRTAFLAGTAVLVGTGTTLFTATGKSANR